MVELQLLLNGVFLAGVYALLAVGLNLVFGVMRVINFAHGELVVLGALLAASAFDRWGWSPIASLLVVVPTMFVAGCLLQRIVIEPVVGAPQLVGLLTTFGLSLVLINGGLLVWGTDERAVPVLTGAFRLGAVAVPKSRLLVFLVAAAATGAFAAFLRLTDWGYAIRATVQSPTMARACGIDVRRVRVLSFGLAAALAGLAGDLLVMMIPVDPQSGGLLILRAFAVVVIGGLGSFGGALTGSLILAIAEVAIGYYVSPIAGDLVAFLLLVALLLVKRQGVLEIAA